MHIKLYIFEVLGVKIGPNILVLLIKATKNCTIEIGATQEAGQQANKIIDSIYKGYNSHLVVAWPLIVPHVRHVCVLPAFGPFAMVLLMLLQ